MSSLRARCPTAARSPRSRSVTATSATAAGATFAAGLVRVPRAWGAGGEAMVEGARARAPVSGGRRRRARHARRAERRGRRGACPRGRSSSAAAAARTSERRGASRVESTGSASSGSTRTATSTRRRRRRPGTSGGCRSACSSTRASSRPRTPRSSARGTSIHPRSSSSQASGIDDSLDRALAGVDAAYVALDLDVLDPSEVDVLIPEPDGPSRGRDRGAPAGRRGRTTIAGIGVTGLLATDRNAALAARMLAAAGF